MLHGSICYLIYQENILYHTYIVVFDVEHPRRKCESTSYLTQISKAKANTFHEKA